MKIIIACMVEKTENGWGKSMNPGSQINSNDNERFPAISADGQILFFASKRQNFGSYHKRRQSLQELVAMYSRPGNGLTDIYWADAHLIEKLKTEVLNWGKKLTF